MDSIFQVIHLTKNPNWIPFSKSSTSSGIRIGFHFPSHPPRPESELDSKDRLKSSEHHPLPAHTTRDYPAARKRAPAHPHSKPACEAALPITRGRLTPWPTHAYSLYSARARHVPPAQLHGHAARIGRHDPGNVKRDAQNHKHASERWNHPEKDEQESRNVLRSPSTLAGGVARALHERFKCAKRPVPENVGIAAAFATASCAVRVSVKHVYMASSLATGTKHQVNN